MSAGPAVIDVVLGGLARATVQGTVAIVLVWLLLRVVPSIPARFRGALWWLALLKVLVALVVVEPIALPVLPAAAVRHEPRTIGVAQLDPSERSASLGVTPDVAAATQAVTPPTTRTTWWDRLATSIRTHGATLLVALWLVGVTAHAWRSLPGLLALRRLLRTSVAAGEAIVGEAARIAARVGLRTVPAVRLSGAIETPQVLGPWRTVVLLPAPGFATLPPNDQAMALCHELVHVRCGDLWLAWLPALVERLFFFNPVVRAAAREYLLAREAACDAAVLRYLDAEPHAYGRMLLVLGVSRASGLAAAGGSFSMLKRRLTMLSSTVDRSPARRLAGFAVIAAFAAVLPIRLAARPAPQASPAEPPVHAVVASGAPSGAAHAVIEGGIVYAARAHGAPVVASSTGGSSIAATPGLAGSGEEKEPAHRTKVQHDRESEGWVLLSNDNTTMNGSSGDVERARSYRRGNETLLWFQHGGREYVIRDAAAIAKVKAIFAPMGELGGRMGKLGAEQGQIGAKQGEIGAKQGAIGAKQGAIGAKQAHVGAQQAMLAAKEIQAQDSAAAQAKLEQEAKDLDLQMEQLDKEMKELNAQMEELDKPMEELSQHMEPLSKHMEELGRQMEDLSKKAESDVKQLFESSIQDGTAEQVH